MVESVREYLQYLKALVSEYDDTQLKITTQAIAQRWQKTRWALAEFARLVGIPAQPLHDKDVRAIENSFASLRKEKSRVDRYAYTIVWRSIEFETPQSVRSRLGSFGDDHSHPLTPGVALWPRAQAKSFLGRDPTGQWNLVSIPKSYRVCVQGGIYSSSLKSKHVPPAEDFGATRIKCWPHTLVRFMLATYFVQSVAPLEYESSRSACVPSSPLAHPPESNAPTVTSTEIPNTEVSSSKLSSPRKRGRPRKNFGPKQPTATTHGRKRRNINHTQDCLPKQIANLNSCAVAPNSFGGSPENPMDLDEIAPEEPNNLNVEPICGVPLQEEPKNQSQMILWSPPTLLIDWNAQPTKAPTLPPQVGPGNTTIKQTPRIVSQRSMLLPTKRPPPDPSTIPPPVKPAFKVLPKFTFTSGNAFGSKTPLPTKQRCETPLPNYRQPHPKTTGAYTARITSVVEVTE
jgi:hypothetical protein